MAKQLETPILETLHTDDFLAGFDRWFHEGIGAIEPAPGGGMRLRCFGSKQGAEACMAFFRPTLPDQIAVSYDLTILSHAGLIINYIALRAENGLDAIENRDQLPPRTGIMANYFARRWGLQSYHVSICRYHDDGTHTGTCNWRKNPGVRLMAHGIDVAREVNRPYRITVTKDRGYCRLNVDGVDTVGFVDHAPGSPDHGKFGFRLIGADVACDVRNFAVHRIKPNTSVWNDSSGV